MKKTAVLCAVFLTLSAVICAKNKPIEDVNYRPFVPVADEISREISQPLILSDAQRLQVKDALEKEVDTSLISYSGQYRTSRQKAKLSKSRLDEDNLQIYRLKSELYYSIRDILNEQQKSTLDASVSGGYLDPSSDRRALYSAETAKPYIAPAKAVSPAAARTKIAPRPKIAPKTKQHAATSVQAEQEPPVVLDEPTDTEYRQVAEPAKREPVKISGNDIPLSFFP